MHTSKSKKTVIQILCIYTKLWQQWTASKFDASDMYKMKTTRKWIVQSSPFVHTFNVSVQEKLNLLLFSVYEHVGALASISQLLWRHQFSSSSFSIISSGCCQTCPKWFKATSTLYIKNEIKHEVELLPVVRDM